MMVGIHFMLRISLKDNIIFLEYRFMTELSKRLTLRKQ